MGFHHDDLPIGRVLARREVLGLLGTATGAALLVGLPAVGGRRRGLASRVGRALGPASARAAGTCVVRPEETEGPYFVDEMLERSDIRIDPSDGTTQAGARLTLAFNVSRLDGGVCTPFEGAQVDVWHCNALGLYSDESANGTVGKKFLRGYQITDADGAATFVTIYPGWYQGRTVHLHFKVRSATESLEFTSQLFFDDDLSDVVFAASPYASKGQRTTLNSNDGIYANGGSQLLLSVVDDGAGGYVASFDVALDMGGTTTTTTAGGSTTSTTLAGGSCTSIATCLPVVENSLPSPVTATGAARRTAQKLQRRLARATHYLDRAASASGSAQSRRYARARSTLQGMLTLSQKAASKGTLGASLTTVRAAIGALLGVIPS